MSGRPTRPGSGPSLRHPGRPHPAAGESGSTVVPFPGRSARQRRTLRWGLGVGAAALLAVLAWVLFLSPLLAVDRVEVTGTRLVDRATVEQRLEPLVGVPLPRIGTGRVEELLVDVPGVESVRADAQPPTGIRVEVTEHVPVARREAEGGLEVLLADGAVLTGVAAEALGDGALPAMDDALPGAEQTVRAEAAAALSSLPAEVRDRVRTVAADGRARVRLGLDAGTDLVWGDASDAQLKGDVVKAFLKDDGGGPDLRRVRELDVSVPERPITR